MEARLVSDEVERIRQGKDENGKRGELKTRREYELWDDLRTLLAAYDEVRAEVEWRANVWAPEIASKVERLRAVAQMVGESAWPAATRAFGKLQPGDLPEESGDTSLTLHPSGNGTCKLRHPRGSEAGTCECQRPLDCPLDAPDA